MGGFGRMGGGFGRMGVHKRSGSSVPSFSSLTLTKTPTAAFSTRRVGSYSGKCIEIDGTTDVDFVNNQLQATTGNVSRWYDQMGSGTYAFQSTDANRPVLSITGKIGSSQAITFDGSNASPIRERSLALPLGLALPSKDCTVITVGRSAVSNALSAMWSAADSDAVSADVLIGCVSQGLSLRGTALTTQTFAIYPPVNPAVYVWSSDASNTRLYEAERSQNRTAATTAETTAGGKIGNSSTASSKGAFQCLGILFYTPALTAGEITTAVSELEAGFSIQRLFDAMIVLDGDSNLEGTGQTLCQNIAVQLQNSLERPCRVFNFGVFGTTVRSIAAAGAARVSTFNAGWTMTGSPTYKEYVMQGMTNDMAVSPAITNCANNGSGLIRVTHASTGEIVTGNSVVISGVTGTTEANGTWTVTVISNTVFDLQGSTFTNAYSSGGSILKTVATLTGDLQTSITAITGAGYRYHVMTIPQRTSFTAAQAALCTAYNAAVLAGAVSWGATSVIDIAADARLQTPSDTTYFADGLHYTNTGVGVVAPLMAGVLNPLI